MGKKIIFIITLFLILLGGISFLYFKKPFQKPKVTSSNSSIPKNTITSKQTTNNKPTPKTTISKKDQIQSKIDEFQKYNGNIFSQKPIISSNSIGKLEDSLLNDGLSRTNLIRFLAGLPNDIELDNSLNNQAQHGAMILAKLNTLTHNPQKPADMDDKFYNTSLTACKTSNLIVSSNYSLSESVNSYIFDSDENNIKTLGHRRWILNPPLKKVGFGLVKNDSRFFSAMSIMDTSRKPDFDYDFISWPSKDLFPSSFITGNTAWSVSINPKIYNSRLTDSIEVKLTRKTDNKIWLFSKINLNYSQNFMTIDKQGFGVPFCIIFRPSDIKLYQTGEIFEVSINNIYKKSGEKTSINYLVEFF